MRRSKRRRRSGASGDTRVGRGRRTARCGVRRCAGAERREGRGRAAGEARRAGEGRRDEPARGDRTADTKAEKVESPDAPTPPDGADAKADAPSDAGGAIGVPACDAYITKYSKCIETGVPADIRDLMKEAIEHSREAWKKAAGGSEKGDLPSICKGALAAAKQATAKYGCVW
jgi:hypothetical protein